MGTNSYTQFTDMSTNPSFSLPKIEIFGVDNIEIAQLQNGNSVEKKTKPPRAKWTNKSQFLMACISFAVGLGNIWRFPALVYEHNGAAFLIPYFTCSFIIGFPMLYLELSLGQYAKVGPAVLYGRMLPFLQGLGWAMVCMTVAVSIYYNILVAWIILFIYTVVSGGSYQWSSCENSFNTHYCVSLLEDARCTEKLSTNGSTESAFYFNGSCYFNSDQAMLDKTKAFFDDHAAVSPAEEFFENYILEKTPTVDSFGGLNVKVAIAYFFAWLITALIIFKGVKVIGKVATLTATVPYVIIAILFVRSVTLEGSMLGLNFYLFEPDFSTIWDFAAWRAAATHVSYSLSVGFGGIIALASYNPPSHNCFRDAAIITIADAFMSIFAGSSVFCVLGFMAHKLNVPIDEVVQSGTGLAFIAYPEALSRMPISWFWALLFFAMLWILGISSQFGYGECMCTALADQFPVLRRNRAKMTFVLCAVLYLCGLILCTRAGIFYFNIFNDYSCSFALTFVLFLESVLVCYIYGYENYMDDLRTMFGTPINKYTAVFGPTGSYMSFAWRFLCPIQSAVIFLFSLLTQITYDLTYGKGKRLYVLPRWSIGVGWVLSILPLLSFPLFIAYRSYVFRRDHQSLAELFRVQPKWPSYERLLRHRHTPLLSSLLMRARRQTVFPVSSSMANNSNCAIVQSAPAPFNGTSTATLSRNNTGLDFSKNFTANHQTEV